MRIASEVILAVTNPAGPVVSKTFSVEHLPYLSVWVSGTALTGTANIDASVDGENFVSVQAITLGGSAQLFNFADVGWHFFRMRAPSGTGVLTAKFSAKGV